MIAVSLPPYVQNLAGELVGLPYKSEDGKGVILVSTSRGKAWLVLDAADARALVLGLSNAGFGPEKEK